MLFDIKYVIFKIRLVRSTASLQKIFRKNRLVQIKSLYSPYIEKKKALFAKVFKTFENVFEKI